MTNYRQARSSNPRGMNQKDGRPHRRTKSQWQTAADDWIAAGFIPDDWNKWTYTWLGEFPVFSISPGIFTDDTGVHAGLVARYAPVDIEILFPYGTDPITIKGRLDDEILAIMRDDTDADGPPIEWIDIDVSMEVA